MGKSTSKFKNYTLDIDDMEKDAAESGSSGAAWYKAVVGNNSIRLLPPMEGQTKPYHKASLHYGMTQTPITCLGEDTCPICKHVASHPDKVNKRLQARRRYFWNILARQTGTVHVFSSGATFFKVVIEHMADEEWGDVTDPIDGFDVVLKRTGVGLDTEYQTKFKRSSTPIGDDDEEIEAILNQRTNLADLTQKLSAKTIAAMLRDFLSGKNVEEETEEEEVKEDPPPKKKAKPAPVEEEEEEDTEKAPPKKKSKPAPVEEEEETEDEPPPKKKAKPAPVEEEEETEDEPPPKKKAKPAPVEEEEEEETEANEVETPPKKKAKPAPVEEETEEEEEVEEPPKRSPRKTTAPASDDEDDTDDEKPKPKGGADKLTGLMDKLRKAKE